MVMNPAQMRDEQMRIDMANQLISQNVPIERIAQQTGLNRTTLTNLVNSQLNIPRPDVPTLSPQGIQTLAFDNQASKPSINLGADIADYITEELGFDGTDNDGNLSTKQMLNAANAAWMTQNQGDTEGAEKLLEVQKLTDEMNFSDSELEKIFGEAAEQVYDMDFEQFIQKPDKSMPIMLFGLSVKEAGDRGEKWPTALSDAALRYFFSKRKDERAYDKSIKTIGLKKQEKINDLVMQFKLLDYKNKAAINLALRKSQLEAPKSYDISNTGDFTDKETVFLDDPSFSYYAKNFPGNIRESVNQNKEAWSIVSKNGGIQNILLDQDDINAWDPTEQDGAILRKGHSEPTNVKLYTRKDPKTGQNLPEQWLSPAEFNYQKSELGYDMQEIKGQGTPKWVIRKDNGEGTWATNAELIANPSAYMDDGNFLSISPDGEVTYGTGSSSMARLDKKAGITAYKEITDKIDASELAVDNYFISSSEQDKLLKDFLEANPGQENLPFNNLIGNTTRLVADLSNNFRTFTDLISSDVAKGGYKFYDENNNEINFDRFKDNVLASDDFKSFLESPLAKFFKDNKVVGQALEATFFDLAMIGAATYSPNKGGVDLRAISDRDVVQFLRLQGAEATSLSAFLDIRNRFARNLINRNRLAINTLIKPTNLIEITGADGNQDTAKTDAILKDTDNIFKKLNDYESQYESSYTFGFGTPARTTKTFVSDPSIDPDNPDVVGFNAEIPAGFAVPSQNFTFQKGYTLSDSTAEGTFRDILNKYTAIESNPTQLTALVDNLNANLTEEELFAFKLFLIESRRATN